MLQTSVRGRPHNYSTKREQYAVIRFNLNADFSSLFTWNTKQVFVYVSANWPNATSQGELVNEAVIWDTIITNPSADHLQNITPSAMKKLVRSAKGKAIDPSRYAYGWVKDIAWISMLQNTEEDDGMLTLLQRQDRTAKPEAKIPDHFTHGRIGQYWECGAESTLQCTAVGRGSYMDATDRFLEVEETNRGCEQDIQVPGTKGEEDGWGEEASTCIECLRACVNGYRMIPICIFDSENSVSWLLTPESSLDDRGSCYVRSAQKTMSSWDLRDLETYLLDSTAWLFTYHLEDCQIVRLTVYY